MNVGLSVSRLMGNAQTDAMKQVSGPLRAELARFREIQSFAQFGSEQLDASTQEQLRRGEQLTELLKQNQFEPLPHWKQLLSIFAGRQGLCDDIPTDEIRAFETAMHDHFEEHETELVERIETGEKLSDEELDQIAAAIENCKKGFQAAAA